MIQQHICHRQTSHIGIPTNRYLQSIDIWLVRQDEPNRERLIHVKQDENLIQRQSYASLIRQYDA